MCFKYASEQILVMTWCLEYKKKYSKLSLEVGFRPCTGVHTNLPPWLQFNTLCSVVSKIITFCFCVKKGLIQTFDPIIQLYKLSYFIQIQSHEKRLNFWDKVKVAISLYFLQFSMVYIFQLLSTVQKITVFHKVEGH